MLFPLDGLADSFQREGEDGSGISNPCPLANDVVRFVWNLWIVFMKQALIEILSPSLNWNILCAYSLNLFNFFLLIHYQNAQCINALS